MRPPQMCCRVVIHVILFPLLALLADGERLGGEPTFFGGGRRLHADPDFSRLGVRALPVPAEFVFAAETTGVVAAGCAVKFGM